jgi:hypothetical protein
MEHQPPLRWTNIPSDGSLASFAKRNQLDPRKLVLEKGLLILPRNAELQTGTINIDVFPSTTKELLATFIDRGLEAELYGLGNIRRELIRKSADVLLPVLFFAGSAAVSVGLNIVASWIYDRWVKKDGPLPTIRAEYAELGADSKVVRWRRIEGPADQVCRLLQEESQAFPASANRLASDGEADEAWGIVKVRRMRH